MTTLIRRPGLVQLPNVTPLQRRTIIYELPHHGQVAEVQP